MYTVYIYPDEIEVPKYKVQNTKYLNTFQNNNKYSNFVIKELFTIRKENIYQFSVKHKTS